MENHSKQRVFKLDPKEYKEKLSRVELENIFLDSFSATVKRDKLGSAMKVDIKDKREYKIQENGDVVFLHSFELVSSLKSKKDYGLKIKCTYSVYLHSTIELTNDFWDIFSSVNLHINTWPYFREFVQSTTQRMSVPPLTLPLIK